MRRMSKGIAKPNFAQAERDVSEFLIAAPLPYTPMLITCLQLTQGKRMKEGIGRPSLQVVTTPSLLSVG